MGLKSGGLKLRLGYKVTFDGQCDRYDGTSVASITSAPRFEADQKLAVFFLGVSFLAKVQIICVTGQPGLPDWVSSLACSHSSTQWPWEASLDYRGRTERGWRGDLELLLFCFCFSLARKRRCAARFLRLGRAEPFRLPSLWRRARRALAGIVRMGGAESALRL